MTHREAHCADVHIYRCDRTYLRNDARITSESVSPRRRATSWAARHSSSGTRMVRCGIRSYPSATSWAFGRGEAEERGNLTVTLDLAGAPTADGVLTQPVVGVVEPGVQVPTPVKPSKLRDFLAVYHRAHLISVCTDHSSSVHTEQGVM